MGAPWFHYSFCTKAFDKTSWYCPFNFCNVASLLFWALSTNPLTAKGLGRIKDFSPVCHGPVKIFIRNWGANGWMCEQYRHWFLRRLPSLLLKSALQGTHLHRIYCWSQSPDQTAQWRGAKRRRLQNQWKGTLVCIQMFWEPLFWEKVSNLLLKFIRAHENVISKTSRKIKYRRKKRIVEYCFILQENNHSHWFAAGLSK